MLWFDYSSARLNLEAFHVVHVITSVGNLLGTVLLWYFWCDGMIVDKTCNYLSNSLSNGAARHVVTSQPFGRWSSYQT